MEEYVSEAIVLRKEPLRDADRRYFLFTKKFGKMAGRAVSARKLTSKLAPHLEPGNLVRVRFVERNALIIADALKLDRIPSAFLSGERARASIHHDLHRLSDILPESQPEPELWDALISEAFSWRSVLRILGWDPEGAACAYCGRIDAPYFYIARQEFFCRACASKLRPNEVLLVSTSNGEV